MIIHCFYPFEIVSRCRDPQHRVGKTYFYVYNLNRNICRSNKINAHLSFNFFFKNKQSLTAAIDAISTLNLKAQNKMI